MSTLNSDSVDKSSESAGSYSFVHDQKPCRGNSSISDLLPDAKWWLNHHELERGDFLDQLNVLETDAKKLVSIYVNGNTKGPAENKLIEDYCNSDPNKVGAFSLDIPLKHFCSNHKSNGDSWFKEFESTVNEDMISNAHVMCMDSCNCFLFERPEKLCSDLDSHWIGIEKIEPWWHAVDKDDLASLISQISSHCIRDCDHPGVQSMHFEQKGSMGSVQQESDQNFRYYAIYQYVLQFHGLIVFLVILRIIQMLLLMHKGAQPCHDRAIVVLSATLVITYFTFRVHWIFHQLLWEESYLLNNVLAMLTWQ